jgi:hypothetical protein
MWLLFALLFLATLGLTGCGGGASNEAGTGGGGLPSGAYTGPPAATDLVQQFQNTIWPHLKAECGSCHVPGGGGTGDFANNNNVNQAYNAAISVTVLGSPPDSELVTKVGSGHNCWLTTNAECAQVMTNWIYEWAGGPAASSRTIVLAPPAYVEPGASRSYPIEPDPTGLASFETYVWPELTNYCAGCHSESAPLQSQQSPFFASDDVATAYEEAKDKIDLSDGDIDPNTTPISAKVAKSRLVIRPRDQDHNLCEPVPGCQTVALDIRDGIIAFAGGINPTGVASSLNYSGALTFNDGVIASGGNRHEANQVALWEFKGGASDPLATTVSDVSLSGGLNLTFSGNVNWVAGYGVELSGGALLATSSDSRKLYDAIVGDPVTWGAVGEYSIEAWVIPANVTQENRYIASYTIDSDTQNFALGQTMYNYDFVQRADGAASTTLSTPDADEVLQANLQHVVTTYDAINGRRIYVNGVLTNAMENVPPTNLSGWQDNYIFAIGDAASGNGRAWEGQVRLMAIYNRALTHQQIIQNLEVGVGEKRFLLFDISLISGEANTYIMFEVSQPDAYSYLFYKPTFMKITGGAIDPNWVPAAPIIVKDMRIGINGQIATLGQAYATLDTQIDANQYTTDTGQVLSTIGTVIPVVNGPASDEFFLSFEQIGTSGSSPFAENDPPAPPRTDPGNQQLIGLRTFEEISSTMSEMTGVSQTVCAIGGEAGQPEAGTGPNCTTDGTYTTYKQQFPSVENIQAFLPAHQMAIAQLAMTYCDELVQDTSLRSGYFPGFNWVSAGSAFDLAGRDALINPLLEKMMNVVDPALPGVELNTQPGVEDVSPVSVPIDDEGVRTELDRLIDTLTVCATGATPSCNTVARTESVVTSTCAATLGAAVMLVQ